MAGAERKSRRNLSSVILGQAEGLNPATIEPGSVPLLRKNLYRD